MLQTAKEKVFYRSAFSCYKIRALLLRSPFLAGLPDADLCLIDILKPACKA